MLDEYSQFLENKSQHGTGDGFRPTYLPSFLRDFQGALTEWAVEMGRCALLEDCGLGKTVQQLCWAQNVVEHTNRPVIVWAPLAVTQQTVAEAAKFGIEANACSDGKPRKGINVANKVPVAHPCGLMDYAGERKPPVEVLKYRGWTGNQIENRYSHWIWRQYASSFWDDIRIGNVLPFRDARDDQDEKHVHPLQLDVIDRATVLWSNPGETVLTPFMGVGSEVYSPVRLGRKAIGIELKSTYFRQAVKNMEQVDAPRSETLELDLGEDQFPSMDIEAA